MGAGQRFEFGACELRPATRELIRAGKLENIQPRAFDTLLYLVSHPERSVGKSELLDRVWGGAIVSDSVVARTIMKVRRAIGDDASEPRFIATQHGHGYRFIGSVIRTGASTDAGEVDPGLAESANVEISDPVTALPTSDPRDASVAPRRKHTFRHVRLNWLAAAGTAVLVAAVATFLVPGGVARTGPIRVAIVPVADKTGQDALAWVRFGLAGVLSALVKRSPGVELVPLAETRAAMRATMGGSEQASSDMDLASLAKSLDASLVVQGHLHPAEDGGFDLEIVVTDGDGVENVTRFDGTDPVDLARKAGDWILSSNKLPGGVGPIPYARQSPYIGETYARAMDAIAQERFHDGAQLLEVVIGASDDQVLPKLELSHALVASGQNGKAIEVAANVAESTLGQGVDGIPAEALVVQAKASLKLGRIDAAASLARDALELADRPKLRADAKLLLGLVALHRFQQDGARPLIKAAVAEYQASGSKSRLASAYLDLGEVMQQLDTAAAIRHYDRALEFGEASGQKQVVAQALARLADADRMMGDCEQAFEKLGQAGVTFSQLGDRIGEAHVHLIRGRCRKRLEQADAAIDATMQAVMLAQSGEDPVLLAVSLFHHADALALKWGVESTSSAELLLHETGDYRYRGAPEPFVGAALNLLQRMVKEVDHYDVLEGLQHRVEVLSRELQDPAVEVGAIVLRAMLAYRQERVATAQLALEHAQMKAASNTRMWVDAGAALIWLHASSGDLAKAEAVAVAMSVIPTRNPALCISRARLLFEQGRFGSALRKQEACLSDFVPSMGTVDDAYRASYARAAATGRRVRLPGEIPQVLWL